MMMMMAVVEVIKRLPGATASNTLDVPDHDVHDDSGDDDDDYGGGDDNGKLHT